MNTYFTQENINDFVNQISLITDHTLKDKNYSNEAKTLIKLSMIGFVTKYGHDYMKQIFDTLLNTEIVYGSEPIDVLLEQHGISDLGNSPVLSTKSSREGCLHRKIKIDSSGGYHSNDTIFISTYKIHNIIQILDIFIHELNHIINSSKNQYTNSNDIISYRTGLHKDIVRKGTGECIYTIGSIFDETINTLQTEEIINCILSLRDLKIDNVEFNSLLNNIDYPLNTQYLSPAYESSVKIVRPLYKNAHFQVNLTKNLIEGNIDNIQNDFDIITGDGSYSKLNVLVDQHFIDNNNFVIENSISGMISAYNDNLISSKKH